MTEDSAKCPKCGHENPASAADCDGCGITFDIYRMEQERAKVLEQQPAGKDAPQEKATSDHLANCPSCGHPTDLSSEDCLKCGIVFTKYYEIQERALADDPEKLEVLRRQKEDLDRAVARRKEIEAAERAERQKKEQMERKKAEALKQLKAKQAKAAAATQQEVDQKKRTALEQQKTAFERRLAETRQQAEQEKTAALEQQKEKQEQIEAARKQQFEQERQQALEQQKAEFERRQAAEIEQAEQEKTAALERQKTDYEADAAERKQQAEEALEKALSQQKADLEINRSSEQVQTMLEHLPMQSQLRIRLEKYEGQTIGINLTEGSDPMAAVLAGIGEDHFSVLEPASGLMHSIPFGAIAAVTEGTSGIRATAEDGTREVYLLVRMYHPG